MNKRNEVIITDGNIDRWISMVITKLSFKGNNECVVSVRRGEHEMEAQIVVDRIDSATGIKKVDFRQKIITKRNGEEIEILEHYLKKLNVIWN